MRILVALHREWPGITYDATIKIEHLLKHRELLPGLRDTGCRFVSSAVARSGCAPAARGAA